MTNWGIPRGILLTVRLVVAMAYRHDSSRDEENENHHESTHYLKLFDLPGGVKAETLEVYLCGVCEDVKEVTLLGGGTAVAEVTIINDVKTIIEKKHHIKKHPFKIALSGPPESQAAHMPMPLPSVHLDMVEVICHGNIESDVLQVYFEGSKSGGKKEKEVEFIKQIEEGVFHVKFESTDDAAVVIEQESHSVMKNPLQVCYVPLPPPPVPKQYDDKKLFITDIPKEVDEDFLTLFIEARLSLENEADFTINFISNLAVLLLHKSYTDEELDAMIDKLISKKIKKQYLTAERCEISRSVLVAGITNKSFTTEDALVLYFESSRSGGGEDVLEKVEMLSNDKAKVTFKDSSVLHRVMEKRHDRLGPNVIITEFTLLDSYELSSLENDSEEEVKEEVIEESKKIGKRDDTTGEKKNFNSVKKNNKNKKVNKSKPSESEDEFDTPPPLTEEPPPAPEIPLKPILHPLDPLLAKYVHLKPSVTDGIQKEFQVNIAIDDRQGYITISPTSSSPSDWNVKSVEMMLEVFSNTLIKVDITVPQEVSSTIYPMVMKACNEGGLQYAFGHGNSDKLAIAGDLDSVVKLQYDVEELSSRLMKKVDEIEVTPEEYVYLKGIACALIERNHSSVKMQCDDYRFTLCLDGSVKDVGDLKKEFPQYLSYASIPVHLHPLVAKFLHKGSGERVLERMICNCKAVPFFTQGVDGQTVLKLLCPHDCVSTIENVAIDIQKELSVKSNDLCKSFQEYVAGSSKYQSFQDHLAKKYLFASTVHQNQLIIVSETKDIETVSGEFTRFITEACSIIKNISIKRGVWRLFHGPMEKKWTDLTSDLREKRVEIVSLAKPKVKKPFVQIKGEIQDIEYATEKILALQANVKERQIPISRPGICQYFFSHPNGQIILRGLETDANVCIEVGVNENEKSINGDVSVSKRPQFERLCFGTTAELKSVSVYVGDITEFNKAEVIVNAANESLSHGAGVAKAIADKGGPVIQEESTNYINKRGILRVSDAVLFNNTGNLPSSYQAIVHVVGPHWSNGRDTVKDIALLKRAIRKSFEKAKDFSSIALPAVSSGLFGFPVDVCANTLFEAVVEFSQQDSSIQLNEINFVIFPDNANEFLKASEKHLKSFQCISSQQHASTSTTPITPVDDTNNTSRRRRRGTKQGDIVADANSITPNSTPSLRLPSATPRITKRSNFIKISKGSIIDNQEEALVNTTDTQLGFGGFVAQALERAAGPGLKQECDAVPKPVAVGSVTVTGGHGLKSKHIFHVVLSGYDGPHGTSEKILRGVVKKCLAECTHRNISTLCMPSIGAGNLKYPNNIVAVALIEEVLWYFEKNHGQTMLEFVHFVIFDKTIYDEFQRVHQRLSSLVPSYQPSYSETQCYSTPNRQQWQNIASGNSFGQQPDHGTCSFYLPHNLKLELLKGDISCDDSDVIVNTTQEDLQLVGSGVSGALLKKAGPALQAVCNDAIRKGQKASNGKVVSTIAPGQLKCQSIFHISLHNTKKLNKIIQTCLEEADKNMFKSIAFPAIGTGVLRYPASEVAKDMVEAFKKFTKGKGPKNVKVIRMVVFQKDIYDQFVSAFKSMGESSGGFLNYLYSGVKAIGSFFSGGSPSDGSDDEYEVLAELGDELMTDDDDFEDLSESDVKKMLANYSEVVLYIYGESDGVVARADKKLRAAIDTQFIDEEIDDASIVSLSDATVRELQSFAQFRNVDIDIDRDPALHSVKLHGCLEDVLFVKDKVRDAMSSYSVEQSQRAVADALYKTVRWMRMTSQETEEDYGEDLNYDIEQAYQNKKKIFDSMDDDFFINFAKMEERDKVTNKTAAVRRVDLTQAKEDIPKDWDPMPMDSQGKEKHVHLVTLTVGNKEYNTVETAFNKTMVKGNNYTQIVSIQRLQNPILYQQFAVRRKEMNKRNPKGHPNEQFLWHGTSSDTHDKINTQGFNRSFAGKNATAYGRGVYFARDSSYSHNYTTPDTNGHRHMYYTQVLTGEFTVGNSSMVVPPPKNPQVDVNILFDATVNSPTNPSIFVVYNDAQNYPAYMVNYK